MEQMGIGVVGCGNISEVYIKNLSTVFNNTKVVAVTDIMAEKAKEKAEKYNIPHVCGTVKELLALPEVEIVLVLTQPKDHVSVAKASLEAGKHTYVEKPFADSRESARMLINMAEERGLYLGAAPDTVLGAVVQTGRRLIDDGWIGNIIGASMSSSFGAPETRHPNPDFLYKAGAGPLFDNGPYAVLAAAYLMGPVKSVICSARRTYDYRIIKSQPHYGEKIKVEVPTFLQSVLTFESGALATIMFSCDTCNEKLQETGLEIYGSLGTLVLSHPCRYDGKVQIKTKNMDGWTDLPLLGCYRDNSRGLGVSDMAYAIRNNCKARLSCDMSYHLIDTLTSIDEAWKSGRAVSVGSTFDKTRPLPLGIEVGAVE